MSRALATRPTPGTPWSRLSKPERKAAAMHAALAGARAGVLASDYLTSIPNVAPALRMAKEVLENEKTPPEQRAEKYKPAGPGVRIMELNNLMCRWPLWPDGPTPPEPERFYCGAVTAPGSKWCADCRPNATRGVSFLFTLPEKRAKRR